MEPRCWNCGTAGRALRTSQVGQPPKAVDLCAFCERSLAPFLTAERPDLVAGGWVFRVAQRTLPVLVLNGAER